MPGRGDVVVFKHPRKDECSEGPIEFTVRMGKGLLSWVGLTRAERGPDDCINYIKRVVGLPGDKVQMIDGVLHINGQRVGTDTALGAVDDFSGFHIGTYRSANGRWFDGAIDEVAVWERVLKPAEIALLYNGGQPVPLTP